MKIQLETRRSVDEGESLVLSSDGGRFLVLVVPIRGEEAHFDLPWKKTFIEWLLKGRSVRRAAELSGVSSRHAYRHKESDEVFRNAWELAREQLTAPSQGPQYMKRKE